MSLPPSVPTLSSPVAVPPNPAGRKSVRTRDCHPRTGPGRSVLAGQSWPVSLGRSVLAGQGGNQLGRGTAAVQELAHVRFRAPKRLERGNALQRLPAGDVED